jgi:hypothetical protein
MSAPSHVEARYLLSAIFLLEGRLTEAIRLFLDYRTINSSKSSLVSNLHAAVGAGSHE